MFLIWGRRWILQSATAELVSIPEIDNDDLTDNPV